LIIPCYIGQINQLIDFLFIRDCKIQGSVYRIISYVFCCILQWFPCLQGTVCFHIQLLYGYVLFIHIQSSIRFHPQLDSLRQGILNKRIPIFLHIGIVGDFPLQNSIVRSLLCFGYCGAFYLYALLYMLFRSHMLCGQGSSILKTNLLILIEISLCRLLIRSCLQQDHIWLLQ